MSFWTDIWKTPAKDWTYYELPPEKTPTKLVHTKVAPQDGYLNIWLQSFRITNVRKGLKNFYGTVHSFIFLPILDSDKPAEFQVATTPGQLKNLDAQNLDHILVLNHRLLGPIPYRGGDVEIEIGLFSIKEADLAGPFLSVLESMSKMAGVSFISTALPFAGPLKDGINLLSGAESDSILEIGLSRVYSPAETGYFAIMRADKGMVDTAKLRIDDHYHLVDDASGDPISEYPYLVFRAEVSKQRDDWFLIPDLASAHRSLRKEVKDGVLEKINEAFAVFRRTAMACPDLLLVDAKRIVAEVEADVRAAVGPRPTAKVAGASIRELKEISLYQ